jgi:putative transcriptional regulator
MPSRRAVLLQAAGAAALIGAAPPGFASLAGQLLIAAPTMGDPRFVRTVILMLRHDKSGAFGIIINRPLGEETIASLLKASGDKAPQVKGSILVCVGGPVEPELGFVVHSADYHTAGTLDVDGKVAMTASKTILLDIGHAKGPAKRLFAFGYSGWGAGQLEGEMARHGWFTAPEEPKLVFDDDRASLWDDAMARRTREL